MRRILYTPVETGSSSVKSGPARECTWYHPCWVWSAGSLAYSRTTEGHTKPDGREKSFL